jgi:hypothetical protein
MPNVQSLLSYSARLSGHGRQKPSRRSKDEMLAIMATASARAVLGGHVDIYVPFMRGVGSWWRWMDGVE